MRLFFLHSSLTVVFFLVFCMPNSLLAYPNAEITASGGPPFSLGFTSTVKDAVLKDDRTMMVCYGEALKLVDMARFALYSTQPPVLTTEDGTNGALVSLAYDSLGDRVYASQEDGDLIIFNMSDLTADPVTVDIASTEEAKELGPIALSSDASTLYIANNDDHTIYRFSTSDNSVKATINTGTIEQKTFIMTDAVYVPRVSGAYFSTDSGMIFFVSDSSDTSTLIAVDQTLVSEISSIAASPDGSKIFATNKTKSYLVDINTSTNQITKSDIDITLNSSPTSVIVPEVYNPTGGGTGVASYIYAGGLGGVSIGSASTDEIFDMGTDSSKSNEPLPTSASPLIMLASSASDGYVYSIFSDLKLGILSANPWVTISSGPTYPSGKSSLGVGESFSVSFKSNIAGTYELRSGGKVDASGTLLKDSTGQTSGSLVADTDLSLTFNYADNSSAFIEGENDIFIFVSDSTAQVTQRGRRAFALSVDTPPDVVTLTGTGFGHEALYVFFNRLTASDMHHYNIYVDTDKEAVKTKSEVAAEKSQPSSGNEVEAKVSGLANGLDYYVAVEAVDAAGNKSASRSWLINGEQAFAQPQETVGPARGAGETSCGLVTGERRITISLFFLFISPLLILFVGRLKIISCMLLSFCFILLNSPQSLADDFTYNAGLKVGIWMPSTDYTKSYFGLYKNVVSRLQGGFLYKGKYGAEGDVGFMWRSGYARGISNGQSSSDKFNFYAWPFELNGLWRMDYWEWKYIIPYLKAGPGLILYRESTSSSSLINYKFGMQGGMGLLFNIKGYDSDMGIERFFITLDGQYNWYNNFGTSNKLDLSGGLVTLGFLADF